MKSTDRTEMISGIQKLWNRLQTMYRVMTAKTYVFIEPVFDVNDTIAAVNVDAYGLEPMEMWDANILMTSKLLEFIAADQIEQLNDMMSVSDVTMELCDAGFSPN